MSTTFRPSRNFEASCQDYLETELASGGWTGVTVALKGTDVYSTSIDTPVIIVGLSTTDIRFGEVGSNSIFREALLIITIYANSDGQRLDLKDFLISVLKEGFTYNTIVLASKVETKTADGQVLVLGIDDTPIDVNIPKTNLHKKDRYRHELVLRITRAELEA